MSSQKRSRPVRVAGAALVLAVALPLGGAEAVGRHATGGQTAAARPKSQCVIESMSPNQLVVPVAPVKVTFSVTVSHCTVNSWTVFLGGDTEDALDDHRTITIDPRDLYTSDAGVSFASVTATGDEDFQKHDSFDEAEAEFRFALLRRSTFGVTFSASPQSAAASAPVALKGTLTRAAWHHGEKPDTADYVTFPKAKVQVQFKASGQADFTTVQTVLTDELGRIDTTAPATKTGVWRLFFPGVLTTGPATSREAAVTVH